VSRVTPHPTQYRSFRRRDVSGGEDEDDIMVTRFVVLPALDIIFTQEEAETMIIRQFEIKNIPTTHSE